VLANAKEITSRLAGGQWVEAHMERGKSEDGVEKYHIRVRLDPGEENE
jgi:hypothetical protein